MDRGEDAEFNLIEVWLKSKSVLNDFVRAS
jgi:hypothetical protein